MTKILDAIADIILIVFLLAVSAALGFLLSYLVYLLIYAQWQLQVSIVAIFVLGWALNRVSDRQFPVLLLLFSLAAN